MSIQIISDSSCDYTREEYEEMNVKCIPFYVTFDGNTHYKEIIDMSVDEIYDKMLKNERLFPKTSTPSPEDYYTLFEEEAKMNNDIICVCITTAFSSSYQSAMVAKKMLNEAYPNCKIEVVNSKINTVAQGLLVSEICKMRDINKSFEEIVERTYEIIPFGKIFFTVGSLDYLKHGGRIGKIAALLGKGLAIKPIILLEDGNIKNDGMGIGRKRSLSKVIDKIKTFFEKSKENPNEYSFAIGYGHDKEEALSFRQRIVAAFNDLGYNISCKIAKIGAAIAVHTGPHAIGLGFAKKA